MLKRINKGLLFFWYVFLFISKLIPRGVYVDFKFFVGYVSQSSDESHSEKLYQFCSNRWNWIRMAP